VAPDRESRARRNKVSGFCMRYARSISARVPVGDVRGLFVRSFDKTNSRLLPNEPLDVVGRPLQDSPARRFLPGRTVREAARRSRSCRRSYGRSPCPTREPGHPLSRRRGRQHFARARTLLINTPNCVGFRLTVSSMPSEEWRQELGGTRGRLLDRSLLPVVFAEMVHECVHAPAFASFATRIASSIASPATH